MQKAQVRRDPALLSLAEARSVPPRELLQACRARIEQWQPRLNAFIEVDETPGGGGVPLAHKDMFYRAGRVSSCGSKIRRDWVANETSAALERLDAAGFADLGRLNMSEFAYGPTGHNEHFGDCKNPWNRLHHRRLLERLGRGGRRAPRVRRARLGYRRLGAAAGRGLRHHRPQDHVGSGPAAWRDAAFAFARHDRAARAQRRGLRDPAAGDRRG
jgi:aspartyl-tRNA(Asn)/glutamyl-tRNA(Gln) amidotransferase subunit A